MFKSFRAAALASLFALPVLADPMAPDGASLGARLFSCPQAGAGGAIQEGECVWLSGSYSRLDIRDRRAAITGDVDRFSVAAGGQRSLGDNWFFSAGASFERTTGDTVFNGRTRQNVYSFGGSVKHVENNISLGASLTGFIRDESGDVPLATGGDAYGGALILRAATLFPLESGLYVLPSLGVGAILERFQTQRSAAFFGIPVTTPDGKTVASGFVTPSVQIGMDIPTEAFFFRPFVFGGITYRFDEDYSRRFPGGGGAFFERESLSGFAGLGATVFSDDGYSVRATFSAGFNDDIVEHTAELRLQVDF